MLDNKLDMLDALSIMSFLIALMNLDENITQGDMQEAMQRFDVRLHDTLEEIHGHLAVQDEKINAIIRMLERKSDEKYSQDAM